MSFERLVRGSTIALAIALTGCDFHFTEPRWQGFLSDASGPTVTATGDGYPPVDGPGPRVFSYFDTAPGTNWSTATINTRYVLYSDGRFAFQRGGGGRSNGSQHMGRHWQSADSVWLDFDVSEPGHTARAMAILTGDLLQVSYPRDQFPYEFYEDAIYSLNP